MRIIQLSTMLLFRARISLCERQEILTLAALKTRHGDSRFAQKQVDRRDTRRAGANGRIVGLVVGVRI
ncbi:MAG: hypothetical protein H6Q78_53 [Candidatus Krumholzibacteriota bacterium]|nr:hypothetical protein [Candidatus Krumholzibacteriota bacterium]